jgi:hypothetical protein
MGSAFSDPTPPTASTTGARVDSTYCHTKPSATRRHPLPHQAEHKPTAPTATLSRALSHRCRQVGGTRTSTPQAYRHRQTRQGVNRGRGLLLTRHRAAMPPCPPPLLRVATREPSGDCGSPSSSLPHLPPFLFLSFCFVLVLLFRSPHS